MAENKTQPVQPTIDPKGLMAAAFLSTPEGSDYLSVQTELNKLQLDDIRERRQNEANRRAQLLAAKASQARAEEAKKQRKIAEQGQCPHRHPNNSPALAGQKFARGGKRDWILMCQLCGKEYDNHNPPPQGLYVAFESFGGPNF